MRRLLVAGKRGACVLRLSRHVLRLIADLAEVFGIVGSCVVVCMRFRVQCDRAGGVGGVKRRRQRHIDSVTLVIAETCHVKKEAARRHDPDLANLLKNKFPPLADRLVPCKTTLIMDDDSDGEWEPANATASNPPALPRIRDSIAQTENPTLPSSILVAS